MNNKVINHIFTTLVIQFFSANIVFTQQSPGYPDIGKDLVLCCNYDEKQKQYSSIAEWNDSLIILVPQFPEKHKIIAIEKQDIRDFLGGRVNSIRKIHSFQLGNSSELTKRPGYDGVEATVFVGNTVFMSIETDTQTCYVVKGVISPSVSRITLTKGADIEIQKPENKFPNAGFESLVFFEDKQQLMTLFEKCHAGFKAMFIDTSLNKTNSVQFDSTIYFRITDAVWHKGDTILALNHHYPSSCEIAYYIGDESKLDLAKSRAYKPKYLSNTFLVKIFPNKQGGLSWRQLTEFQREYEDYTHREQKITNWEGMIKFDQGVLLISDPNDGESSCRFRYIPLPN